MSAHRVRLSSVQAHRGAPITSCSTDGRRHHYDPVSPFTFLRFASDVIRFWRVTRNSVENHERKTGSEWRLALKQYLVCFIQLVTINFHLFNGKFCEKLSFLTNTCLIFVYFYNVYEYFSSICFRQNMPTITYIFVRKFHVKRFSNNWDIECFLEIPNYPVFVGYPQSRFFPV